MMNANPLTPAQTRPASNTGIPQGGRFAPVDPMRVLRQYVWVLVATTLVSLVVGLGLWFALLRYSPKYTSISQLATTSGISDPYQTIQQGVGWRQTHMDLIDAFIMNQVLRLRSEEVLDGALRRDNVRETAWFESIGGSATDAREALLEMLEAQKVRGSTVIEVSLTTANEDDPPVILDAIIGVYLDKLEQETGRESDSVRLTFVRERDRAEEEVQQVDEQMQQFTVQNDLPAIETRNHEVTIAYRLLNEQKTQLEMALQSARESYPQIVNAQRAGGGSYSPQQLVQADADPTVAARNERLLNLQTQRQVLLDRFGEKHHVVREIDHLISATEGEKMRQIELFMREMEAVQLEQAKKVIDSLEAQLEALRPSMEENRAQLRDLGLKLDEFARLEERARVAAEKRLRAEEVLSSMRVQTDRPDSTQVRPIFSATEAKLSFPKIKIVVPGVMLGMLAIVTGIAFLRESLDQRIKSPADTVGLRDCPLLGVIPDTTEDPSSPTHMEGIVRVNPTGLMAESFRQTRTALLTQISRTGDKTLLLVGAQAGTGTSVVANNLAMSLAYDGKRVLLLDANYRRPAQHKMFGITIEPGLIEVLAGSVGLGEAIVHIETPEMDVLPVGHAADALPEMFESATFRDLLGRLKDLYDVILIDVPPALLTSDGMLMANHTDAVAVVVRAMQDRRGMLDRMLRQLGGQHARLAGVILNGVRSSAGGYFRKNYQAFYSYRQQDLAARTGGAAEPNAADTDAELIAISEG